MGMKVRKFEFNPNLGVVQAFMTRKNTTNTVQLLVSHCSRKEAEPVAQTQETGRNQA